MDFRKVTAIVQLGVLEKVERKLLDIGVRGISVTKVKGFGEYANFYSRDWVVGTTHARIEIFTATHRAQSIVDTILEAAHTGLAGDGIVVVLPVESAFRIRTQSAADADRL